MTVNATQPQTSSSIQTYHHPILLVWSGRNALRLSLLPIIAAGMAYSNIAMPSYLNYIQIAGTLAGAVMFLTLLRGLHRPLVVRPMLLIIPVLLIAYQVGWHGVVLGRLYEWEFLKYVTIYSYYMAFLMAGSAIWAQWYHLQWFNRAVGLTAYMMGALGVLQFAVANALGKAWYPIPEGMRVSTDFYIEKELATKRFGGLVRGTGLATEPSYYGAGMTVLLALCLTSMMLMPCTGRARLFQWGAVLMSLIGVLISVSGAAWGLALLVIIAWFLMQVQWRGILPSLKSQLSRLQRRTVWIVLIVLVVAGVGVGVALIPFTVNRFQKIQSGADTSANSRLLLSLDLIRQPSDTFTESFIGTGVGLEANADVLWDGYQRYGMFYRTKESGMAAVWNGYSYFVLTGGYIGLALVFWLVWTVVRIPNRTGVPLFHLTVLAIFYPFAHGMILFAEWYAILILVWVIRSIPPKESV